MFVLFVCPIVLFYFRHVVTWPYRQISFYRLCEPLHRLHNNVSHIAQYTNANHRLIDSIIGDSVGQKTPSGVSPFGIQPSFIHSFNTWLVHKKTRNPKQNHLTSRLGVGTITPLIKKRETTSGLQI